MGSALLQEDEVWSRLDGFRRRVDQSLEVIAEAAKVGRLGVCFSGGKDSTVVVDLVRRVVPGVDSAFFDSGCELASTMQIVRSVGSETIHPRLTMLDMARYAGWWGYADPVDRGCPFNAKLIVIDEPAETFVVRRRLRVLCDGLRAEESSSRRRNASTRGTLYEGADRTWRCSPIAHWKLQDVWAYIASRGLQYNVAYDRMMDARIPRESQRVATLLGARGSGWGRHALLRRAEPERWSELAAEFPGLALLS
jgi:phosphoadenosine phosphosulfate reductase